MELQFAAPAPDIAPFIAAYYRVYFDYPRIEDIERADVGYLRFMLSGRGYYEFASGARHANAAVTLLAPTTQTARYSIEGPLLSFGCVLRPAFWGGIVAANADAFANRSADAALLMGDEVMRIFDGLTPGDDAHAIARRVDAFLRPRIKPLPRDHAAVINAISHWIGQSPIPALADLYAACAPSPRQVMRCANRFFGAPPKMLARKFRALRTASLILGTKGQLSDALFDDYADRAHLSREVKQFTGLTPRALQINSSPIMQITLKPANFNAMAPWSHAYHL